MELELHQLDLRYEPLRLRHPQKERHLLASLAEVGQQCPIIVLGDGEPPTRYVLLDGYKRLRGLHRLGRDLVLATRWLLPEPDALVLEHRLREGEARSALEDGWLLRDLVDRFTLSEDQLAARFGHSKSWVSRRLGLVADLPEEIQAWVRSGAIGAHAAMRHLLPMARANEKDALALARAVAPLGCSSRQLGTLVAAFQGGQARTRELVLSDPALVLRAHEETRRQNKPKSTAEQLLGDLQLLGGVARRAQLRLRRDAQSLLATERDALRQCAGSTWSDLAALKSRFDKEVTDDRPTNAVSGPEAA